MKARIGPPGVRLPATRRPLLAVSIAFALLTTFAPASLRAAGGDPEEARAYFEKATTAFALGHFPEAADSFEKAYEAKPDSALLYNAAQAHRLAGNKERALTLYQNYLRLYPKAPKRAEVETRVTELKRAIEHDHVVATTPPTSTLPAGSASGEGKPGSPSGADQGAAPNTGNKAGGSSVTTAVGSAETGARPVDLRPAPPAPPAPGVAIQGGVEKSEPLTSKPLFWAAVGGAVVAGVAVVVLLALSGDRDPAPSLGVVR